MPLSSTAPTAPGWYWMTNQTYPVATIVLVQNQHNGPNTNYLNSFLQIVSPEGFTLDGTEQWEGPLSP